MRGDGPDFTIPVARNGYAWWYVDALSHDGVYGLTIIAFIGSVFSPYYKWARRAGEANPLEHCALNVALYGPKGRWAMTERGSGVTTRDVHSFNIGPSSVRWEDDALVIDICERASPLPWPVRGRVRVRPETMFDQSFPLDANARHRWRPIAPVSHVEVEMEKPGLSWSGPGYLDHNNGDEPLEAAFTSWDWSRAHAGSDALIHYDAKLLSGADRDLALRFRANGAIEPFVAPPKAALPATLWRVDRNTRCDADARPQVLKTLEDTPFYARSVVQSTIHGERLTGVHERLRLDRFCAPIVQGMLPFRMPRIRG